MLTLKHLVCTECGSSDCTSVELQVDRGGKLVRFRVDCHSRECNGTFSHYLPYSELNRAVKRYLERRDAMDRREREASSAGTSSRSPDDVQQDAGSELPRR